MGYSIGDDTGVGQFAEFLFKLKEIEQKEKEIKNQEIATNQAQGVQHTLLEAQLSSSKQTLEVIKLTRMITFLTVALVVIGLIQIALSIVQVGIERGTF